ncbi:MAG TPA: anti-sigma factor [Acidisoma sp.]|uniref:anti-sigma factor n=1 Tax=Acidisoma sp. TaxID=1872115 RepID=UPI002B5F3732|nr:anti-sigma factor [Acidisoma sp.]HTI01318.1 anti-sigma factor [Acidisoma sp.]
MSGTSEDDDLLAAEYVLGVLEGSERDAVLHRADREHALADAIIGWENRLAPLAVLVPPVAPPLSLWPRIAATCGLSEAPAAAARPAQAGSIWGRLGFWRGTTAAGFALAAAMAALVILRSPPEKPLQAPGIPLASAVLTPPKGSTPFWLAAAGPNGAVQFKPLQKIAVAVGHDLELWGLPDGEKVPKPLGLITPEGKTITLPASMHAPMEIMVSLEQKGGSTTGLPQGPVLWLGHMDAPQSSGNG